MNEYYSIELENNSCKGLLCHIIGLFKSLPISFSCKFLLLSYSPVLPSLVLLTILLTSCVGRHTLSNNDVIINSIRVLNMTTLS